jgi:hypothetical protein
VSPSSTLADGAYTAVAVQDDTETPPDVGSSPAVTFRVDNAAPSLLLEAPSLEPVATQTPTVIGDAGTGLGDAGTVTVVVYPGASTDAVPSAQVTADVESGGSFSATLTPALSDGVYTVIAGQSVPGRIAFSAPVTVEVNATPPALTMTSPAAGANISQNLVEFAGAVGTAYGDTAQVNLALYHGSSATGTPVGTQTIIPTAATWSASWPSKLALGIYTLQAQQPDAAGAVSTVTHTFIVIPALSVVGQAIAVSCRGDVLILTRNEFRTQTGGPRGHLRVMFARFTVRGGSTLVVKHQIQSQVLRLLRRAGTQPLSVAVAMSVPGLSARQVFSASRKVRVS